MDSERLTYKTVCTLEIIRRNDPLVAITVVIAHMYELKLIKLCTDDRDDNKDSVSWFANIIVFKSSNEFRQLSTNRGLRAAKLPRQCSLKVKSWSHTPILTVFLNINLGPLHKKEEGFYSVNADV